MTRSGLVFTKYFALHFTDFGLEKFDLDLQRPEQQRQGNLLHPTLFETGDPAYDANKSLERGRVFTLTLEDASGDGRVDIDDLRPGIVEERERGPPGDDGDGELSTTPTSGCTVRAHLVWNAADVKESRMAGRVDAVVFDVLETLLDLDPIGDRLEAVGQPAAVLGPFFMRFQRDAMALTLAGDVADFTATARQALRTETKHAMSEDAIAHVLEGFGAVPAFPDAAPALRKLSDAGVAIGCLTVGDPDNTRSFLASAGLEPYVDHVVTCDAVGVWKPAPEVYHHAAKVLACELDRMALVAVHAWDCHGAKKVGALAGWCSRLEGEPGDVFLPSDVRGDDLVEVVEGLLAL